MHTQTHSNVRSRDGSVVEWQTGDQKVSGGGGGGGGGGLSPSRSVGRIFFADSYFIICSAPVLLQ